MCSSVYESRNSQRTSPGDAGVGENAAKTTNCLLHGIPAVYGIPGIQREREAPEHWAESAGKFSLGTTYLRLTVSSMKPVRSSVGCVVLLLCCIY